MQTDPSQLAKTIGKDSAKLTADNFMHTVLSFRDRQAGVSVIYDHLDDTYSYNAYCLEIQLLKELFTCEYEYLDDALEVINSEFGTWDVQSLEEDSGCGSCIAK